MARRRAAGLRCVRYGTDEIRYEVDLARPTRVVENEVYWKGWTATVGAGRIEAKSVDGLRGWDLPAGRYQMVARFTPPHQWTAGLLFVAGLAAWAVLCIFQWRTRRCL